MLESPAGRTWKPLQLAYDRDALQHMVTKVKLCCGTSGRRINMRKPAAAEEDLVLD